MANLTVSQNGHILRAEMYIIGSILLDNTCLDIALEMVKSQDFDSPLGRTIFSAIEKIAENGEQVNQASILSIALLEPTFEANNGISYLSSCVNNLPSANSIEHFCKIVRQNSIKRRVIEFSDELRTLQWTIVDNVDEEVAKLSDKLLAISSSSAVSPWKDWSYSLSDACTELMNKDAGQVIQSGFIDLDAKITGFKSGELVIVAARPGMGKTALGLNILMNVAFYQERPIAFFSLEMTRRELVYRVISAMVGINGNAIREKHMKEEEWQRLFDFAERYKTASIYIDETPALNISTLRARAHRMHRQYGISMIIIDYIQLMHADIKNGSRELEIATISRSLKEIAKTLHIPVIALSQLNRNVDSRADKHPILSDIRESGSIEQDADKIFFIYREDCYRQDAERDNTAEIMIAKQRNGPTGIVKLHWSGEYTRFSNLEQEF